jgi:hypothetical protein
MRVFTMMGRPKSFLVQLADFAPVPHITSHGNPQIKRQTQRQVEGKSDAQ